MRITKTMAEEMAKHIVLNSEAFLRTKKGVKGLLSILEIEYNKQLPQVVRDCFEQYPNYIKTGTHFYIHNGKNMNLEISYDLIQFALLKLKLLPNSANGGYNRINLGEQYDEISGMYISLRGSMRDIKDVESQLKGILYRLTTIDRIVKEYPELVVFVGKYKVKTGQEIAPNYRSLIEKLK